MKTLWKKKKMVISIFSFSTMFSTAFFFRVIESWDCVVKSLWCFLFFPQCFQKPRSRSLKILIILHYSFTTQCKMVVKQFLTAKCFHFCCKSSSFNHNSVSCFIHRLSFFPEEYINKTVNQEMHKLLSLNVQDNKILALLEMKAFAEYSLKHVHNFF